MEESKQDITTLFRRWHYCRIISCVPLLLVAISLWWLRPTRHASQHAGTQSPLRHASRYPSPDIETGGDDALENRSTVKFVEAFERAALYGVGGGEERWRSIGLSPPAAKAQANGIVQMVEDLEMKRSLLSSTVPQKDRYEWVQINGKTPWAQRYAHASVMNNKGEIFVIGGATMDYSPERQDNGMMEYKQHSYLNDVWMSTDSGKSWDFVIPRSKRFDPRRGHAGVMNANKVVMFILGGFCGQACFLNDWWSSETGAVWHSMGHAPWSARHGHATIVTSKEWLVLMGGHDGEHYCNDVWGIQDPSQALVFSSWQKVSPSAEWHARYGHAAVVDSDDAVILFGGFFADKATGKIMCFNDIWRSEDGGRSWSQVSPAAQWSGRYQHAAEISSLDEIFVIGGLDSSLNRCGDAWRSRDMGQTWTQITHVAAWEARYEHAVVLDPKNDSIYIIGGVSTGAERFGDVWRSRQTCQDDIQCTHGTVCRDDLEGLIKPLCLDICDRRIFDECARDEACTVKEGKQVCVNPCVTNDCGPGQVCEVAKRGELVRDKYGKIIEGQDVATAEAYCLACSDRKTKFACDQLDQCAWDGKSEICVMRCSALKTDAKCSEASHCEWKEGECGKK